MDRRPARALSLGLLLAIALAAVPAACGTDGLPGPDDPGGPGEPGGPGDPADPGDPGAPPAVIDDGIVATFAVAGEQFRVWVTNATTIAEIFALAAGTSRANIPNGKLLRGPGAEDHNAPWSWHLDPEDIHMAENTIEACDGRPSTVEDLLDAYLTVGRYCPWSAQLVSIEDHR